MRRIAPLAIVVALACPGSAMAVSPGGTAAPAQAGTGGMDTNAAVPPATDPAPAGRPGAAKLRVTGLASAPRGAPPAVRRLIRAANLLQEMPYRYGGGHADFEDDAYDCSGTVSFALHGGGLLDEPLDSSSFMDWGEDGPGRWVTIYTNPDHVYLVVAGLRLDTSRTNDPRGENGPRWRAQPRPPEGFTVRHPPGL